MSDTSRSSSGARLLDRVSARVDRTSIGRVHLGVLALAALRTGVWWQPNVSYLVMIAEAPTRVLMNEPRGHYLYGSWLSSALAHVLHATSNSTYVLVHLGLLLLAWGVFGLLALRWLEPATGRRCVIAFALLPVSTTALYWIGPDGGTLLLMVLLLAVAGRRGPPVLVGVALGMQHFEQAVFGVTSVLVFLVLLLGWRGPDVRTGASARFTRSWAVQALVGVAAGKLLLAVLFEYWGMRLQGTRISWFRDNGADVLRQVLTHPHVITWSVLAVGWYLVARRWVDASRRERTALTVALTVAIAPVSLVADQTRVGALTTFLLLAVVVLFDEQLLRGLSAREVGMLVLAAAVPYLWCWGGVARSSVLLEDARAVLHHLVGWPELPVSPWDQI